MTFLDGNDKESRPYLISANDYSRVLENLIPYPLLFPVFNVVRPDQYLCLNSWQLLFCHMAPLLS